MRGRSVLRRHGDDGAAGDFLPVEEQGIAGNRDHVAHHSPVVHGDHTVVLHQRAARVTAALRVRIDAVGQVPPVDEFVRYGVPPVLARVFGRIGLVEQVPAPLPEAQPVGIVEHGLGIHVVVHGAVGISFVTLARRVQALQKRIGRKRGFLHLEGIGWKRVAGYEGCKIIHVALRL